MFTRLPGSCLLPMCTKRLSQRFGLRKRLRRLVWQEPRRSLLIASRNGSNAWLDGSLPHLGPSDAVEQILLCSSVACFLTALQTPRPMRKAAGVAAASSSSRSPRRVHAPAKILATTLQKMAAQPATVHMNRPHRSDAPQRLPHQSPRTLRDCGMDPRRMIE
jgi:hypothetical protein